MFYFGHSCAVQNITSYNVPSAHPTNDVSIELKIQWNFVMVLFIIYSADDNEIFHKSQK